MTSRYHAHPRRSEWPALLLGGVLYAVVFYGALWALWLIGGMK